MSPELIAPQRFGFKNSRPTKSSDCYALGMVIYETISGNLPFHKHTDPTVIMKVLEGKRPPRGAGFTRSLWETLELCWTPQPNARPSIENVLQCLEMVSNSSEPPSPEVDEEMGEDEDEDEDGDDWDLANGLSDTMTTGRSLGTSSGLSYLTNRPPSSVLTAPAPSIDTIVEESPPPASDYSTSSSIVVRNVTLPSVNHPPTNLRQAHPRKYSPKPRRPSSQPNTSSHDVITNPSPSMVHRSHPGGAPPSTDEPYEFMRIPNPPSPRVEQEVSVPQDKDFATMWKAGIAANTKRASAEWTTRGGLRRRETGSGSPLYNSPQTARPATFSAGSVGPTMANKPMGGMVPLPPSPEIKAPKNTSEKLGEPDVQPEGSSGQGPQTLRQPQQLPFTTSRQPQQVPRQQPPTNPTSAPSSASPLTNADATPSLIELQRSGMDGSGELVRGTRDFDQVSLREGPGDTNFGGGFGQWVNSVLERLS